jgi:hypothetical protein
LLWVGFIIGTAFRSGIAGLGRRSSKIMQIWIQIPSKTMIIFQTRKREENKSVPDPDLQDLLLFVPPATI